MIRLLSRWLIPDRDNVSSPAVRRAYGTLCGAVGIALNILLFIGKFFAGQLSGSIAVTADAFNNLSDAGSSAVTLLGFRLAGKKPDTDHPFGHGRIEYISGLIVAGLILLMGVELAKSSFDKILHPEAVTFSLMAIAIMAASVCVKVYMWLYNRAVGRKIKSAAMEATAADSLSDSVATTAVLLATPALAVRSEMGYYVLYQISPAVAQLFQPVRMSCTNSGVTMEVAAVRVEGDTAQAYITLSGGPVDAATDLFDSYSFHLPFDQSSHCERVAWDEAAGAVTFLCTVQTLDGSPIPTGGKMTFSVRQLLTGKQALEGVAVDLDLADYAGEAETAQGYSSSSGADGIPMLLPGEVLAEPAEGIAVTAAGYVDGTFHVQARLGDIHRTDNHCRLWLEDAAGAEAGTGHGVYFRSDTAVPGDDVYEDFLFDVPPEDLAGYTLHGDFYTATTLTEGLWQVTFPLENTR